MEDLVIFSFALNVQSFTNTPERGLSGHISECQQAMDAEASKHSLFNAQLVFAMIQNCRSDLDCIAQVIDELEDVFAFRLERLSDLKFRVVATIFRNLSYKGHVSNARTAYP